MDALQHICSISLTSVSRELSRKIQRNYTMYYVAYSKDPDLIWPYKEHLIRLEMLAIYQNGTYLHPEKNQLSYYNILFEFLFVY